MYDSMELLGEQTVQALVMVLQLASLAGCALLLVGWSMRETRSGAKPRPLPILVPRRTGYLAPAGRDAMRPSAGVRACLPARAPPPDRGIPPDDRPSDARLHRIRPDRLPGN
jgi:hypothetical protein